MLPAGSLAFFYESTQDKGKVENDSGLPCFTMAYMMASQNVSSTGIQEYWPVFLQPVPQPAVQFKPSVAG